MGKISKKLGWLSISMVFAVVCLPVIGFAERPGNFGIGAILGGPTGISVKFWVSERNALDGALSWTSSGSSHFHFDYLWHDFTRFKAKKGSLPLYYGVGGRFNFDRKNKFGVRGAIGVAYLFADVPLETFFEIVPFLQLIPDTDAGMDVAIGIRYLFK